jgi:hypothetical protein
MNSRQDILLTCSSCCDTWLLWGSCRLIKSRTFVSRRFARLHIIRELVWLWPRRAEYWSRGAKRVFKEVGRRWRKRVQSRYASCENCYVSLHPSPCKAKYTTKGNIWLRSGRRMKLVWALDCSYKCKSSSSVKSSVNHHVLLRENRPTQLLKPSTPTQEPFYSSWFAVCVRREKGKRPGRNRRKLRKLGQVSICPNVNVSGEIITHSLEEGQIPVAFLSSNMCL